MRVHIDERRTAYCDLFDCAGDVNLFIVHPGARTCWHRHEYQRDQFRVIRGAMRFGTFWDGIPPTYVTLDDPGDLLPIEPGLWHGYECISQEPAYLLMYLDKKWNPKDEERMSEDEVPWEAV